MKEFKNSSPKVDFLPKVRGEAKFVDDISFPDMLFATTLRSTVARGLAGSPDQSTVCIAVKDRTIVYR